METEQQILELNKEMPIGFMDSGLGGLSVLREAVGLMPKEDFIYIGDSLNAPYGTKDPAEIRALTFHVVEQLLQEGIKGLAVACNTATGAAVKQLRVMYPNLPLVGIEPAIKPAVEQCEGGQILVMATPMTIAQDKFKNLLALYEDQAEIIPVPCKGLMEFVEEGDLAGEELVEYFDRILSPHLTAKVETIVLGCTHYPFLKPQLQKYLDQWQDSHSEAASMKRVELIDGSLGTARELKRRLGVQNLLRTEERIGEVRILNSKDDPELLRRSQKLFTMKLS